MVGVSFAAMACDHSNCRPYVSTTVCGPLPSGPYAVEPSSPYSHGLHTSTDHSSFAFSSTSPFPLVNA